MNSATGLWMLLALGALTIATGLPVWALLVGVASAFAAVGLALGQIDLAVLSALPGRITGLLEHDLLQALPLYVFVGVLLQRLQVADALFSSMARAFGRSGAGQPLAALGVGVLVAPMNGSVASSSALLARLVAPRLGQLQPAGATALIAASATLGVVVPPSLVLILLGDTMLRAHTEASNLPGYAQVGQRIVNTQDVFHAALLPALAILLLWVAVTWWHGRRLGNRAPALPWSQHALALVAAAAILLLLGGVFTGQLFAVEAAATGGMLLVAATLATRALPWAAWREVLHDTLTLSGALFALLVGATTFSLVFRLWGTDLWITDLVQASPLPAHATAALVLLAVALCAWVLDAFEMIFVVIPIVAPALVLKLGDAQQTAVLLLLVLQLSFLIPPMGYAVLMARARAGFAAVPMAVLVRALAPYVLLQALVIAAVFAWPASVHLLDPPQPAGQQGAPLSEQDIIRQMEQMAPRDEGDNNAPATPK
jgi:TRAP-type mannitol/chloroaromatic compound transport system permease large subunit